MLGDAGQHLDQRKLALAGDRAFVERLIEIDLAARHARRAIADLDIADQRGVDRREQPGAAGPRDVHRIDQQLEIGPGDLLEHRQRGGEIADRVGGDRLDGEHQAIFGGQIGEHADLVDGRPPREGRRGVHPGHAELADDVELGAAIGVAGPLVEAEAVDQRDRQAAIVERGDHLLAQPGVVEQAWRRRRHPREVERVGEEGDVGISQVGGHLHGVERMAAIDGQIFEADRVHGGVLSDVCLIILSLRDGQGNMVNNLVTASRA